MSTKLSTLEERIAELEKSLGAEGSDDEHDESASEQELVLDNKQDLEPIPPLRPDLVPPLGMLGSAAFKRNKAGAVIEEDSAAKSVHCKHCEIEIKLEPGQDSFRKHTRTLRHRQNVILHAGAGYEHTDKQPNHCKACQETFPDTETLMAHRETKQHKLAKEKLRKACYCAVCEKQFSSPLQLREHIGGKAHIDTVESKTGYRPYDKLPSHRDQPRSKKSREM